MARIKIDYGIDLGTTNSAICRMEQGEPVIKKTDTQKDTLPSCVSFTKKKLVRTGDGAKNDLIASARRATKKWEYDNNNTFIEFKRAMGCDDKYYSSYMEDYYTPEQLSSEILKTLRSYITDEEFKSVVITVPAKFTLNQKDATMRAAKSAGFEYCELLQEPIAASMAYGIKSDSKNGYWLVFDFGGGTFDAALLKIEDGIMQVFDTEGDNYLGGKNLDYAIVDEIIIPYLQDNYEISGILADTTKKMVLREAMKTYAENAKIALSFKEKESIETLVDELGTDDDGEEIELFMDITRDMVDPVLAPYFKKAINITLDLLSRNGLSGEQIDSLILVGGPTYTPVLRKMLSEQITNKIDTSIDPMTAVACGAALYASTIENSYKEEVKKDTIDITLKYESTSVEAEEFVVIKLNSNSHSANFSKLWAEFVRSDKSWSSGRFELNSIGDVISCQLRENKSNNFIILVYDECGNSLDVFPNNFTIIQGSKVGNAVLPYNIGVETWNESKGYAAMKAIKGLEKNQSIPAIGVINGLKTTKDIRPGISMDVIKIPIYQAENGFEGLPAICYEYIYEAVVTGENIPQLVPAGSDVDITIKIDRSETVTMEIYIPIINHTEEIIVPKDTVQENVSTEYLENEIKKAEDRIKKLKDEGEEIDDVEVSIDIVKSELRNGDQRKQVLQHLKEQLRLLSQKDSFSEWLRLERKLKADFSMLKTDNEKYGNSQTTKAVEEIEKMYHHVMQKKSIIDAKMLLNRMFELNYKIAKVEYYISWLSDWARRFDEIKWKDTLRAKQLVDRGMEIVISSPSEEKLSPIVSGLIKLLPKSDVPNGAEGLLEG